MVTFPACFLGVVISAVLCMRMGKELPDDKAYQARLAQGLVEAPTPLDDRPLPKEAYYSVVIFFGSILLIVACGFFPQLRVLPGQETAVSMSLVIEGVMLAAGALMCMFCKPNIAVVTRSPVLQAGVVSLGAVFGIAWMTDSFIAANREFFLEFVGQLAQTMPMLFALILAVMSALLASQGATTRAVMPLGFALGIHPMLLIAMFPAVNCLFVLPVSGPALAAVAMDRSGTTHIGKFVFNHSFQIPGLIMVASSVAIAFGIVKVLGY